MLCWCDVWCVVYVVLVVDFYVDVLFFECGYVDVCYVLV